MRFKTLTQLMSKHDATWLYNGIDVSYRNVIEPWFNDWFAYRFLCVDSSYQSDDMWQIYFKRTVNLYGERYLQLVKNQIYDFDPTLVSVFDSTLKNTSNGTEIGKNTRTNNNTSEQTSTTSHTGSDTSTINTETSNSNNNTSTNKNETTSTNRNIHSDYPQSNVSENLYNWNYASDSQDVTQNGTSNTTTTNEGTDNGTVDTTNKMVHDTEQQTTSNITNNSSDTSDNNVTRNNTTNTEQLNKTTGNKAEQYKQMFDYIKSCDATNWLIKHLDKLFLSMYDIDIDEQYNGGVL